MLILVEQEATNERKPFPLGVVPDESAAVIPSTNPAVQRKTLLVLSRGMRQPVGDERDERQHHANDDRIKVFLRYVVYEGREDIEAVERHHKQRQYYLNTTPKPLKRLGGGVHYWHYIGDMFFCAFIHKSPPYIYNIRETHKNPLSHGVFWLDFLKSFMGVRNLFHE
jgi:hypothetical protein